MRSRHTSIRFLCIFMFIDLFGANIRIICETFRQKEQNIGSCIKNLSIKIIPFELSVLSVLLNGFSSFCFRHLPCSSVFRLKISPEGLFFSFQSSLYCIVFLPLWDVLPAGKSSVLCNLYIPVYRWPTGVGRTNDWSWSIEWLQFVERTTPVGHL